MKERQKLVSVAFYFFLRLFIFYDILLFNPYQYCTNFIYLCSFNYHKNESQFITR